MPEILHINESMETPKVTPWHWIAPIIISLVVTGGTILVTFGSSTERLTSVEQDVRVLKESAATKEQVQELKLDVREVKADVKELIKQGK